VGVPKVKSAFALLPVLIRKTNTITIYFLGLVLLIFVLLKCLSFYLLSFTWLFGFADPTLINGKKGARARFLLRFSSKIGKIYLISLNRGG
jgi:hypothetical protein